MHGEGARRTCGKCGQRLIDGLRDVLANRELRGPRQITSSDIDRVFDDRGRFLLIEEKGPSEAIPRGQQMLLRALAAVPEVDVWGVRGTPDALTIREVAPDGKGRHLGEGSFDDYQRCIFEWFQRTRVDADRWLDALAEAPFDPPPWCPAEVWREFDAALMSLLRHRERHDAA